MAFGEDGGGGVEVWISIMPIMSICQAMSRVQPTIQTQAHMAVHFTIRALRTASTLCGAD